MSIPRKDKIYVLLQFLVFIGWLFDVESLKFQISENLHSLGFLAAAIGFLLILVALVQIGSKISPFPSPPENARLKTTGAFAFARHPIYSGVLFIVFGAALWLGSGFKLLISLLLYLIFFLKSRYEERRLLEKFSEYAEYRNDTGRFFPKFKGRI
ncbi:methyltransferase family protein [Salinimicrobium oceani]|uniref:Isoprenylcysteine carboxylmethyltransferase family protein n=1 Tax=Salinimicrobium oceani TaxID=2722702 RepID=A0ABX1CW09_9FLAO|nr:isoprenylcysteine carboxylmethyltransferase family protein [Salinimicrobium oceani]NJW51524.1 isoprenylcysteine carboxylmethyltransferase family protein [Salinimicrobium oceani]